MPWYKRCLDKEGIMNFLSNDIVSTLIHLLSQNYADLIIILVQFHVLKCFFAIHTDKFLHIFFTILFLLV